jgi:hypothetical protein
VTEIVREEEFPSNSIIKKPNINDWRNIKTQQSVLKLDVIHERRFSSLEKKAKAQGMTSDQARKNAASPLNNGRIIKVNLRKPDILVLPQIKKPE